jgi:hypothetical protein
MYLHIFRFSPQISWKHADNKSNEIIRVFLLDSEKGITLCFQTNYYSIKEERNR